MWLERIVTRSRDAGNASNTSRLLRALPHALLRAWRIGGLFRTAVMLLICGLLLSGLPMPFSGLLLPVSMLFIGEADLARRSPAEATPARLVVWRLVNTLIAAVTLLIVTGEDWTTAAALGLFIVSFSGMVRGRGLAGVTAAASVANLMLPMVVGWGMGAPHPFWLTTKVVTLSLVIFPAVGLLLHLRARRLLAAQQALRETVVNLEHVQLDLRSSEQRLQEWNQQLNASIEAQTAELEERNRYLSIINAVSFALAEPMDDFRSLERASRLVARLMGARGAQALHRFGDGEAAHFFVTVAPEDVHAPRLPEALLWRVAQTGVPVISKDSVEEGLPDLGEPYAVVPIAARGQISGAFALLGTGELAWADQERHLLLLIGREMGVSLENMRLYREAIEHVEREEIASGAARLLDVPDRREEAVQQALQLVGQALDAWDIALVTLGELDSVPTVLSSFRSDGDEDDWLLSLLDTLPALISGRSTPLVLGAGGELPLAEAIEVRGIGTLVLVPIISMNSSSVLPQQSSSDTGASETPIHRALSGVLVVAMAAGVRWRPASTELAASFGYALACRIENDQLVALQRQRIRELSGLADVARTMQLGGDVDRLYAGFAQALTGLLDYDRLYIARVDEYGQVGDTPSFGADGSREDCCFADQDSTHTWFALRVTTTWELENGPPPSFVRQNQRYYLVVPMRPKGQVLGIAVFAVDGAVAGDQLHIVEQAVEQLGLALDGATLYQQATERASHIQALSNLARIVASVVDLREAFAAFAEEVRWLIPFDRAVMLLIDESERDVQPYATYPEESLQTPAVPLRESIASAAVDAGAAVLIRRSDPVFAHLDWKNLGPDVSEAALVPVQNGTHAAAVFALVQTWPSSASPDLSALDEVAGLLGVTIERLRLYERAEHTAKHDLLTGLPNYRYLQERLSTLRAGLSEPGESAVLMIDMDGLKLFNDTLGHEAGDQAICIVARELQEICRADDFVARTGGDEFVVVMEGAGSREASRAAERIHAALREAHLEIPAAPARLGVSIGVATGPEDAQSANRLLHAADQAMYAAKFSGGHRTRLARDRSDDAPTRSIPQRDTHLVETMIRTAADGATSDERSAITTAQRWVMGVISSFDEGIEAAPWVRMVVAQHALSALPHVRLGVDQEMARFFLDRVREDWRDRSDEIARATLELTPLALRLAAAYEPSAGAEGRSLAEEVRALRLELGDRVTARHEALFTLAIADRLERRQERDAA